MTIIGISSFSDVEIMIWLRIWILVLPYNVSGFKSKLSATFNAKLWGNCDDFDFVEGL